jgi:hypothetical protein
MGKFFRLTLTLGMAAAIASLPSLAAEKRKSVESEEEGVQRAIAFQRAKDRADARQARKQARNPEKFTYATPQSNPENSLATEQKKDAAEKSADREAPPK